MKGYGHLFHDTASTVANALTDYFKFAEQEQSNIPTTYIIINAAGLHKRHKDWGKPGQNDQVEYDKIERGLRCRHHSWRQDARYVLEYIGERGVRREPPAA